jgi:hypothetical protein
MRAAASCPLKCCGMYKDMKLLQADLAVARDLRTPAAVPAA